MLLSVLGLPYYQSEKYMIKILTLFIGLFGSKLSFIRILDSIYGAFWRCSHVRQ